jgi:hypothetical protein
MTPYDELCAYTLNLRDPEFLHQLVVDAQTLQTATAATKPMALAFALLSLYLSVEKNIFGRQIQRFHMQLANKKIPWPPITLPSNRGSFTAAGVLAAPPGPQRNLLIHAWAASVWSTYAASRNEITALVHHHLDIT